MLLFLLLQVFTVQNPPTPLLVAKRRSANHPCPVCGKFYVNEGSLRKHLACHPEMATQLAASASALRMWPCSVCTAVFTHEGGLLAHMEQMRMEPKHQVREQGETLFNLGLRLVSIKKPRLAEKSGFRILHLDSPQIEKCVCHSANFKPSHFFVKLLFHLSDCQTTFPNLLSFVPSSMHSSSRLNTSSALPLSVVLSGRRCWLQRP